MREALIVWGGWSGHEPEEGARILAKMLESHDFKVYVENTTEAFADPGIAEMNLIVPIVTMSKIEKEEVENLTAAVRGGVGLAGFHGGMCDAFRESVEYQFMCGGQWVAHPGNIIDYAVDVVKPDDPVMKGVPPRFPYRSEQYYMHVDPSNEVLATTTFSGEHASWIEGVTMPVVWKRKHGAGRVFYSSLGHVSAEFAVPEMRTILEKGDVVGSPLTPQETRSATIRNPILPGFNPDPSICRVGDDYYIATSTFEWYPGVQIHHSRDLVNWRLVRRPLERASQLDMRGDPDSGGVWAPCLSHADGRFWLVYTDVKRLHGNFKDSHNYIVTAATIEEAWSDPIYVNSSGFDPSLFHDDDGRKWFVNMIWSQRDTGEGLPNPAFAGIVLQQWDAGSKKLLGKPKTIFKGSGLGLVEGPHLFKREGWYYLTTAEGGTGYKHAVTMARSRQIDGPYELHPEIHLITSKDAPEAALQRSGHGQIVETADGQVYHTHLCSRPLAGLRRSPLGRETAIQKCVWREDGWLYLAQGGQVPALDVPAPFVAPPEPHARDIAYQFSSGALPFDFQWLRTPYPERIFSLDARPGWLRLIGRESLGSWFEQALVARRQQHFVYRAETEVEFAPHSLQQAAGLVAYYNRYKFHFLCLTWDEKFGRCLMILSCEGDYPEGRLTFPLRELVAAPGEGPVRLAVAVDHAELQFSFAPEGGDWRAIGGVLDASLLSDEAGTANEHGSFTGAFVGMAAFDVTGGAVRADFRYFEYADRSTP